MSGMRGLEPGRSKPGEDGRNNLPRNGQALRKQDTVSRVWSAEH